MSKKIRIKDVAAAAGVSSALVSYVLNARHVDRINKDTAKKITEIAKDLGYYPNQIAKSLKTRKTYTIGLMLGDIVNPFSHQIARIIEDEAKCYDYAVIAGSCDEDHERSKKLMETFVNRQVDGFIIVAASDTENQLAYLEELDIPFVLIDRYFPEKNFDYIVIDNYQAAYTAVSHLIEKGYQKIALVNYETSLAHLKDRTLGYTQAIADSGRMHDEASICSLSMQDNPQETKNKIAQFIKNKNYDAIFAATNTLGIEILKQFNQLHIRVPDDAAFVCFDETDAVDLFYAKLTHIRQPMQAIGNLAVQRLIHKINHVYEPEPPYQVVLKSEFVINKSSG